MNPREEFLKWLLVAWEWAEDNDYQTTSKDLAELISHAQEPDYPLWEMAIGKGIVAEAGLGRILREACGPYQSCPTGTQWEKAINYSPVIYLDEQTWRDIHGALGWVNRNHDRGGFWLWSNAGNVVRFMVRSHE